METKLYKIINKAGLFSNGGSSPGFTKVGKAWSSLGHLEMHLQAMYHYGRDLYKKQECEIVEYIITEVARYTIEDSYTRINDRAAARKAEQDKRVEDYRRERELAELHRLQAKYLK